MKTIRQFFICLVALLGVAQGIKAEDYITDVMLIGAGGSINDLKVKYLNEGWKLVDKDLNAGAGGAYVFLLYKTNSSQGSSMEPITDFYLRVTDTADHPNTISHKDRTYNLTPGGGNDDFNNGGCDLNRSAGGKFIYLYYTKQDYPYLNRPVTSITFDGKSDGALGKNGTSEACDLNNGAGGEHIFMHFTINKWEEKRVTTSYRDLDGGMVNVRATVLTPFHKTLDDEFYVLDSDITNDFRMVVRGSVHIILKDGATMNNHKGITCHVGNSLTFWGQSDGDKAGSWNVLNAPYRSAGIGGLLAGGEFISSGEITINGGNITAYGGGDGAGIGSSSHDSRGFVTINGGTVNAFGGNNGAGIGGGNFNNRASKVTITGGTVTGTGKGGGSGIGGSSSSHCEVTIKGGNIRAIGGTNGYGIGKSNTTYGVPVRLDYTNDVSIYSTGYNGYVSLLKDFKDLEGNFYAAGDVSDNSLLAEKTLVSCPPIELADHADNSSTLGTYHGMMRSVRLPGRTIARDGCWNTLCLPFDLTAEQIAASPLKGAIIKQMDNSASGTGIDEVGTLTLKFKDVTSIETGMPYILKWNIVTIGSKAEWNNFATKVNSGTYKDVLVRLTADIDVTTTVGTEEHPFKGIFDGQGHTMKVNLKDEANQGTAPFRYISDATICNVKTTGSISGGMHCAGLVGFAWSGTNFINNCEVAATVTCNTTHCGGILGHGKSSKTTMTDCLFSGSLSGGTTAAGIIFGWGDNFRVHLIENCLANGTYRKAYAVQMMKGNSFTQKTNNCYANMESPYEFITYTTATGSDLVALLGDGWEVRDGQVVPKITAPDIVSPVFDALIIKGTNPIPVTSSDGKVQFMGQYAPFTIDESNKDEILFLSDDCRIGYSQNPRELNNFRAHFSVKPIGDGTAAARTIRIDFGDGETTGIQNIGQFDNLQFDNWYDLQGRKLNGKPKAKGVYINNGRSVIIK